MEIIRYYLTGSFNMHKHSHLPQSKSFQSLTKQKNPLKSIRALSQNEMRAFFFFFLNMKWILFLIHSRTLIIIQALTWSHAWREKVVNNRGMQPYIPFPSLSILLFPLIPHVNASILELPKAVSKNISSYLYQSQILVKTL